MKPRTRRMLLSLLVAVAAVGLASTARAADDARIGGIVTGRFAMADKGVPLPEGWWEVVALAQQSVPARNSFINGPVKGAVLASLSGNTVERLVVVHANVAPTQGGWGIASDCARQDIHFAQLASTARSLTSLCGYVNHVVHGVGLDSAAVWIEADDALRGRGWSIPETWLVVGFRVADEADPLDVRYYFNPDQLRLAPLTGSLAPPAGDHWLATVTGVAAGCCEWLSADTADARWAASPWSPGAVSSDAWRAAVIAELVAWSGSALEPVHAGFKNRSLAALANPAPWAAPNQAPEAEDADPAPSADAGASVLNDTALWKTFTWRAAATGIDMVLGYALTGSVAVAGVFMAAGAPINAVAYYLHEIAWERLASSYGWIVNDMPPTGIDR